MSRPKGSKNKKLKISKEIVETAKELTNDMDEIEEDSVDDLDLEDDLD